MLWITCLRKLIYTIKRVFRISAISTHAGFLQVRENWKKSGNLSGPGKSGKGQGKYFFWKSQGKVSENEMLQLVKDLLSRFVKRDVIDSLVTCNDVTSFDTNDASKHNSAVDLGFIAVCKKLVQKTPIKYPVARFSPSRRRLHLQPQMLKMFLYMPKTCFLCFYCHMFLC